MPKNRQPCYELAAIIINFRTADLTIDCLGSLLPQLGDRDCVVVVDNHSGDGSADAIEQWLREHDFAQRVKLIRSPGNGGFAAGNNIGIKAVDADFYLLLNSDTVVRPGALAALRKAAIVDYPNAGAVGARLEWPDGALQDSRFRDFSPLSELINAAATGPLTRLLKRYDVTIEAQDHITTIDWLSFACIVIPSAVIEEIGLLDEGFFMYFEDVEYCRRIRQTGRNLVHVSNASVVHLHGGSSSVPGNVKLRRRLPGYYYRSRRRYYRLAYGPAGPLAANICWTVGRAISLLRELFGRAPYLPRLQWLDIWLIR